MKYKLKKICSIKHGYAFKGEYITNVSTKYFLVTPGNFKIGGGFKKDKCKYYDTKAKIASEYILNPRDLIVTMTDLSVNSDTLGYCALVPDDNKIYLHNQRIGLIYNINEKIVLKEYLYWYMRTSKYHEEVVSSQSGTAVHHTSPERILNISIDIPCIKTQKKIIKILNNLEKKIEQNTAINNDLYELGRNIYKKTYNNDKIPRLCLNNFFNVITGKKDANASVRNGRYPFFTCSKQVLNINEYSFDDEAILLAGNGDFNVKFYRGKFDAYQRTYVLIPFERDLLGVLFFAISNYLNDITASYRGSVIKFITKGNIEKFEIPYYKNTKIEKALKTILIKIEKNNEANRKIEQLRNTLLPKLMNGEIDLDSIEI